MEFTEVIRRRGFKPSDRFDPQKAEVLSSLTKTILHLEERKYGGGRTLPADWRMRRIIAPTSPDFFQDEPPKPKINKKVFATSDYFTETHPTMDEEKVRAREISSSITLPENANSKGQFMYQSRKKKSVKWVHQGHEFQNEIEEFQQSPNWNSNKRPAAITQHHLPVGKISIGDWEQRANWSKNDGFQRTGLGGQAQAWNTHNTAPRGYSHGQPIYHPIFLK